MTRSRTTQAAVLASMMMLAASPLGCASPAHHPAPSQAAPPVSTRPPDPSPKPVVLSIIGTSDLHGRVDRLPVLAGFMTNLRRARSQDGGVIIVDAGDMFQGTLESNLAEGAPVIDAYNSIGYAAASIGNHEFDYGPEGPRSTAKDAGDNPRGALAARARQARFPFLTANIVTAADHTPLALPSAPSTVVEVAGVRVGIIGVSSMETLRTTAAPNVADLQMLPLAPVIQQEAARLRNQQHAQVVVVAAHAGGACEKVDNPKDLSSCDNGEVLRVARELPGGTVDVIVGGHTHRAIAHEVNGIAVIQSWAQGRAFGRVDMTVEPGGRVVAKVIRAPHELCQGGDTQDACDPGQYEGAPVVPDASIAAAMQATIDRASEVRKQPLGVEVETAIGRQHRAESALGNLLTDLMLAARPGSDVAVINEGGIRADLPAGPLQYGSVYAVFPFDNRFAKARIKGAVLTRILAENASHEGGFLSISGVRATIRCGASGIEVDLRRANGKPIRDDDVLVLLASDFLATGGDVVFQAAGLTAADFELEQDPPIREELVNALRRRGGRLRAQDLMPAGKPRVVLPGPRPVVCAAAKR
jgi:2',3'-cyclic-nucleotide 2'-phosphodiesterase (5'-nucleotidase family)